MPKCVLLFVDFAGTLAKLKNKYLRKINVSCKISEAGTSRMYIGHVKGLAVEVDVCILDNRSQNPTFVQ